MELENLAAHEYALRVACEQRQHLINLLDECSRTQGVHRTQAQTLKTLGTGLESLETHFNQYPVASYTNLPSRTNLTVTQEAIFKSIAQISKRIIDTVFTVFSELTAGLKRVGRSFYGLPGRLSKKSVSALKRARGFRDIDALLLNIPSIQLEIEQQVAFNDFKRRLGGEWNGLTQALFLTRLGDKNIGVIELMKVLIGDVSGASNYALQRLVELEKVYKEGDPVKIQAQAQFINSVLSSRAPDRIIRDSTKEDLFITAYPRLNTYVNEELITRTESTVEPSDALHFVETIAGFFDRGDFKQLYAMAAVLDKIGVYTDSLKRSMERYRASTERDDPATDINPFDLINAYTKAIAAAASTLETVFVKIELLLDAVNGYYETRKRITEEHLRSADLPEEFKKQLKEALKQVV